MDWRLPYRLYGQVARRVIRTPHLAPRHKLTCSAFNSPSEPWKRTFASGSPKYHDAATTRGEGVKFESSNTPKRPRRKKRALAAKAPLAKIAQDAEVSLHGPLQSRDPRVKHVTAFCVAEEYDLVNAQDLLQRHGIPIGPCGTILYPEEPQVVHVQMPFTSEFDFNSQSSDDGAGVQTGDVFIFPSGVVVAWGVPSGPVNALIEKIRPAARNKLGDNAETEDLEYIEDDGENRSSMRGERIVLGVKPVAGESFEGVATAQKLNGEVRTVLAKIAFSSGLATATKISVLENQVDDYAESTRAILSALRGGNRFQLRSRKYIYGTIARLLDLRAQLNLYSELTDDLPDLLWEARSELRMEKYYDQVGRVLDTAARIKALNQKMDYSANIVHELRDMRSEIHSSFLEKIIIVLIGMEIGLVLWTEYRTQALESEVQRENNGTSMA